MNGVKRGLFSNEAGSGSAPCAAAAADEKEPVKMGLIQALGVFIDTIVICSCTAFILLLVPEELTRGLMGMELLQTAMNYHLGSFGVIFVAVILALFSFSTFLGILFYARSNVSYLFGNRWLWQTLYKILALIMLFIGENAGILMLGGALFFVGLGIGGNGTIFMKVALSGVAPAESSSASGTYNVFRDMTAPFGVAIFVPMFVTGMTKKAATGMAVPAAAASALHSVALVQLICVIVGIVVCFLIPSVHKKAEAAKE